MKLLYIDLEVLRVLLDSVIAARAVDRRAGREPSASFSSPAPQPYCGGKVADDDREMILLRKVSDESVCTF
jgi:hypothetical protein